MEFRSCSMHLWQQLVSFCKHYLDITSPWLVWSLKLFELKWYLLFIRNPWKANHQRLFWIYIGISLNRFKSLHTSRCSAKNCWYQTKLHCWRNILNIPLLIASIDHLLFISSDRDLMINKLFKITKAVFEINFIDKTFPFIGFLTQLKWFYLSVNKTLQVFHVAITSAYTQN